MNSSFLVDVSLPKYFSFFNESHFIFVSDINLRMSDTEIWNYALENELIILTKDTDFYNRLLVSENAPKVIYFQLGNFSLKQLYQYFTDNWIKIQFEIDSAKLIIAKETHIECIR
jgi:predicted nuclease of predicted toxin-antitoxin system